MTPPRHHRSHWLGIFRLSASDFLISWERICAIWCKSIPADIRALPSACFFPTLAPGLSLLRPAPPPSGTLVKHMPSLFLTFSSRRSGFAQCGAQPFPRTFGLVLRHVAFPFRPPIPPASHCVCGAVKFCRAFVKTMYTKRLSILSGNCTIWRTCMFHARRELAVAA